MTTPYYSHPQPNKAVLQFSTAALSLAFLDTLASTAHVVTAVSDTAVAAKLPLAIGETLLAGVQAACCLSSLYFNRNKSQTQDNETLPLVQTHSHRVPTPPTRTFFYAMVGTGLLTTIAAVFHTAIATNSADKTDICHGLLKLAYGSYIFFQANNFLERPAQNQ